MFPNGSLRGFPRHQRNLLCGGKREIDLLRIAGGLLIGLSDSLKTDDYGIFPDSILGLGDKVLLPGVAIYTISQNLVGTMKRAHYNTLGVPIWRLHFVLGERLDARESFRASRCRVRVNDLFVEALEQAPCSAFTYRFVDLLQDALQVTTRKIDLINIVFSVHWQTNSPATFAKSNEQNFARSL